MYTATGMCHVFMLTGCLQDRHGTVLPRSCQQPVNIKGTTHTSCCIYRVVPPDDEQSTCSKHVEVNY